MIRETNFFLGGVGYSDMTNSNTDNCGAKENNPMIHVLNAAAEKANQEQRKLWDEVHADCISKKELLEKIEEIRQNAVNDTDLFPHAFLITMIFENLKAWMEKEK